MAREEVLTHAAPRERVLDDHMFVVKANGSTCRLQLFTAPGVRPVAVATQTTHEGTTLINCANGAVSAVWQQYFPDLKQPPIWIQHQIMDTDAIRIQLVCFTVAGRCTVASPSWCTMPEELLQERPPIHEAIDIYESRADLNREERIDRALLWCEGHMAWEIWHDGMRDY